MRFIHMRLEIKCKNGKFIINKIQFHCKMEILLLKIEKVNFLYFIEIENYLPIISIVVKNKLEKK